MTLAQSPTKVFYAAPGSRLRDKDAQIIGSYVEKKLGGAASAEDLVAAAKSSRSPLHHYFDWDDTSAASKWRVHSARLILNSICIKLPDNDEKIRAFHHITLSNGDAREAYVSHEIIWQQPDLIAQVLAEAKRELAAFARKYRAYQELGGAVDVVEGLIESLQE